MSTQLFYHNSRLHFQRDRLPVCIHCIILTVKVVLLNKYLTQKHFTIYITVESTGEVYLHVINVNQNQSSI